MAKLRYDSVNNPTLRDFVWEGTPEELLSIYDGLKQRLGNTIQIENNIPRKYDVAPIHNIKLRCDYTELAKKMPTIDQLAIYILSKPKFEHDIVDVATNFFGKQIKSREYGRLYRQLRTRLENARKLIEVNQHGAFERRTTHPRNLQRYTFRPVNAMPLGTQEEKIFKL